MGGFWRIRAGIFAFSFAKNEISKESQKKTREKKEGWRHLKVKKGDEAEDKF